MSTVSMQCGGTFIVARSVCWRRNGLVAMCCLCRLKDNKAVTAEAFNAAQDQALDMLQGCGIWGPCKGFCITLNPKP